MEKIEIQPKKNFPFLLNHMGSKTSKIKAERPPYLKKRKLRSFTAEKEGEDRIIL